jgi:2,3,4,5-tetrahydropyridine-2-carboxylate N-succinyltransferase
MLDVQSFIEEAWSSFGKTETRNNVSHKMLEDFLDLLDSGQIRVCQYHQGEWVVQEWVKKGILLCFRQFNMGLRLGTMPSFDKIPLKCQDWTSDHFWQAQFRAVPGALVRKGAYVAPHVILMPSFINIGAWVGEQTMIDTWSTIGSCAQIGARCHISGGVGIGGVLEPLQSRPTVIEEDCFIGARSEVAEGVIVEKGSVLAMGVFLGASTKIIDRNTGVIYQGRVPPYSVVVPGSMPSSVHSSLHQSCAVIVKQVDEKTRQKTSINDLLR